LPDYWQRNQTDSLPKLRNRSSLPGELLIQDLLHINDPNSPRDLVIHLIVDAFDARCFGCVGERDEATDAAALLSKTVERHYRASGFVVQAVSTDRADVYVGDETHPYERYLGAEQIKHSLAHRRWETSLVARMQSEIEKHFQRLVWWNTSLEEQQHWLDEWCARSNLRT
jgi:hypothetical protein